MLSLCPNILPLCSVTFKSEKRAIMVKINVPRLTDHTLFQCLPSRSFRKTIHYSTSVTLLSMQTQTHSRQNTRPPLGPSLRSSSSITSSMLIRSRISVWIITLHKFTPTKLSNSYLHTCTHPTSTKHIIIFNLVEVPLTIKDLVATMCPGKFNMR